jgi:hypothetical protein
MNKRKDGRGKNSMEEGIRVDGRKMENNHRERQRK